MLTDAAPLFLKVASVWKWILLLEKDAELFDRRNANVVSM